MAQSERITVLKLDHNGCEVWRYEGTVLERGSQHVTLEARFNRDDRDDGYIIWRRGDRFVEHFYTDRWYNVFEVYDVEDDHLKGWYCNFTRPAEILDGVVRAEDLSLDLFVFPDGRMLLLDEDDFAALPLSENDRAQVRAALDHLTGLIRAGKPPFTFQNAQGDQARPARPIP